MRKHIIAFAILSVLTLFWCLCGYAADEDKQSGLFRYKLKGNGTAIITGFDWNTNGAEDVYVPKLIDGYEVSEIGASAFSMEAQKIPREETHSSLEFWIFNGISEELILEGAVITLPDTITAIGEKAFFLSCISSINIPQKCQIIGSGAFAGCDNLSSFSVEAGNEIFTTIDGVLYNKKNKELISFPFGKDTTEKKFSVPKGIIRIGDYAFYGLGTKKDVEIPSTVKQIGKYAFALDTFLTVDLTHVEIIDDYSFYHATF